MIDPGGEIIEPGMIQFTQLYRNKDGQLIYEFTILPHTKDGKDDANPSDHTAWPKDV